MTRKMHPCTRCGAPTTNKTFCSRACFMDRDARFWAKVEKSATCWLWTGAVSDTGYGSFNTGNKTWMGAHRYAYRRLVGEPVEGMHLDHKCRNRRCVNPDHLEEVTPRENASRGFGWGQNNATKMTCPHGHAFTDNNIYRQTFVVNGNVRNRRVCKACHRRVMAEVKQRKLERAKRGAA